MVGKTQRLVVEDILDKVQIDHILRQSIGTDVPCKLEASEVKPAVDGIAGFLGEHLRIILYVEVEGEKKKVHLFLKRLPTRNDAKAEYLRQNQFFLREYLMFKLMEEICKCDISGPNTWYVKAYIYTESLSVMPDLSVEGYRNKRWNEILDLEHVLLSTTSLARFHAAFVNYETNKSIQLKRPHNTFQEYGHVLTEGQFCVSDWLKTSFKVANFVKAFSTKSYRNLPNLESKLAKLNYEACDTLKPYKDTVNVIIHKDLWVNNILFKYENDVPVNAVLIDYQTLRYGPPVFDLMIFLYFTTDKLFRENKEIDILDHYYSVFIENLNDDSNKRIKDLDYDKDNFLNWCEKARMFGMVVSMAIYPFILMDSKAAAKMFDDPETCNKMFNEDRTEPALAYANICEVYKQRILSVSEEFIERYMVKEV